MLGHQLRRIWLNYLLVLCRFNGPTWCEAVVPLMPSDYQTAYDDYTGIDTEGYHDFSRRLEEEKEEQAELSENDTIDVEK